MAPLRTALAVEVPEAEPVVRGFRERFDTSSVERRIPPHVTVLFPFAPAGRIDDTLDARLRSHFGGFASFAAELTGVRQFGDDVIWLAPEPRALFLELLASTWAAFPRCVPYDGEVTEPEPHLTVGWSEDGNLLEDMLVVAEQDLVPRLPVRFVVGSVALLAEQPDGTWVVGTRYALA